MRYLIGKDLALIGRQGKFLFVYLLVFIVLFSGLGNNAGFLASFLTIVCFMLSINCFAYDEQCHFDKLLAAGPVPPLRAVAARYLSAFLIGLGGGLLTFGVTSIVQLVKKQPAFFETLFSVLASLGIGLFLTAVLFPIFYKFGTSKSRILMLLIVALPAVALPLAVEYFPDLGGAIPAWLPSALPAILAAVLLAALAVSVPLSCRIVRRKTY